MWKNKSRLVVWEMDNLLDLDKVKGLLELNYNHSLDFLQSHGVSNYDMELQNKWIPADGSAIQIKTIDILGEEYRCLEVIGKYESNLGEARSIVNGTVLPREVRVFNHAVSVLFFEFMGKVYSVLEINPSQESRIRSALFGQRRGNKIEEWGSIEFNEPLPFNFSSEFYYWLFSKQGESLEFKINNTENSLAITDVAAVSHHADKKAYDSSSIGADLLRGSISALSGLGSNEDVYQAGFKLIIAETNLLIRFGLNGVCILDRDLSYHKVDSGKTIFLEEDFKHFVLMIYGVIFHKLLEIFSEETSDGKWNEHSGKKLRKEWALIVIQNLTVDNELDFEDFKDILKVTVES